MVFDHHFDVLIRQESKLHLFLWFFQKFAYFLLELFPIVLFVVLEFEMQLIGFFTVVIKEIIERDFLEPQRRDRDRAHHEGVEGGGNTLAGRTLNAGFIESVHQVHNNALIAF